MTCQSCRDPRTGQTIFPLPGLAPHVQTDNGARFMPREEWPARFREDPDNPKSGTWTNCPRCGDGE